MNKYILLSSGCQEKKVTTVFIFFLQSLKAYGTIDSKLNQTKENMESNKTTMNKEKKRKYDKARYEANKQRIIAQSKVYYEANKEERKIYREVTKEKIKARMKAYYKLNKQSMNTQMKTWRLANKNKLKAYQDTNREKTKAQNKVYNKAHPEKFREASHKRRALEHRTEIESINEKVVYLRDGWICQHCKKRINKKLKWPDPMCASLDHIIPLSKGGTHTYNNIQLAHLSCNLSKHTNALPQGEQTRLF